MRTSSLTSPECRRASDVLTLADFREDKIHRGRSWPGSVVATSRTTRCVVNVGARSAPSAVTSGPGPKRWTSEAWMLQPAGLGRRTKPPCCVWCCPVWRCRHPFRASEHPPAPAAVTPHCRWSPCLTSAGAARVGTPSALPWGVRAEGLPASGALRLDPLLGGKGTPTWSYLRRKCERCAALLAERLHRPPQRARSGGAGLCEVNDCLAVAPGAAALDAVGGASLIQGPLGERWRFRTTILRCGPNHRQCPEPSRFSALGTRWATPSPLGRRRGPHGASARRSSSSRHAPTNSWPQRVHDPFAAVECAAVLANRAGLSVVNVPRRRRCEASAPRCS